MSKNPDVFTVPWMLAIAFLLLAAAIFEKGLNVLGLSMPFVDVFPRQLLDWAVAMAIFEIALTLRQLFDARVGSEGALPDARPGA